MSRKKPARKNAGSSDPSRHTIVQRASPAKSRRVGPTQAQRDAQPRDGGHRTAVPRRPREGQPAGHVGAR